MQRSTITSLLLITLFSSLAYLPLTPFMGFYSEDFFFGYIGHFYGQEGLIKSLIVDRPFNGYILGFFYYLLGDNLFFWHINMFLMRLFGGYVLFFALLKILPGKIPAITFITLLFLTYPGFLQQTLPLGYLIYPAALLFWIGSLFFNLIAIKTEIFSKLIFFTTGALILQLLSFFTLEFFIGLEILRFLIFKKNFKILSPYLFSLALFIFWRIFFFKGSRPETDIGTVAQTYYFNLEWVLKIPLEIIQSFVSTAILAYFVPTIVNFLRNPLETSFISILTGILSAGVFYFYYKRTGNNSNDWKLGKEFFIIGIISVVGALIPIILFGRMVRPYLVYDRYTITSIIGVSFLLVGLLYLIPKNFRIWAGAALIFLSITSHLMNGYYRAIYWDKQKDLWWQLYWRAPKIEDGSMLILDFPKLSEPSLSSDIINKFQWYRFYWAEEQIWTAGNLFFNYNNPPINHFHGDFLADKGIREKIQEGSLETFNNRNIIYTRDFKNSIIISTPSDVSCLQILDGDKLIKAEPSVAPPRHIFGSEPSHDWCYFFQKASLARQLKDFNKLSQLKKEVLERNLKPKNPNEWVPFMEDLR